MTFAERLAEIMADRGKTQSDIARHLGIRPQSVGQWGKGVKPTLPRGQRLDSIARFLEVSVSQLMAPPGSYFDRKGLAAVAESAPGGDQHDSHIVEDRSKGEIAGAWDHLTQQEKSVLIGMINAFRAARGEPPIAI